MAYDSPKAAHFIAVPKAGSGVHPDSDYAMRERWACANHVAASGFPCLLEKSIRGSKRELARAVSEFSKNHPHIKFQFRA